MPALPMLLTQWPLLCCRQAVRICVMVVLLLACSACASKEAYVRPPVAGEAGQAWETFTSAQMPKGPFRVSATLRYETPSGESTRVAALMWGNGSLQDPYPLRLDIQASIGITVAKIREDGSSFQAYSPDEKTVYTNEGPNRTLTSFGLPIPVSLGQLSRLLNGQANALFAPPITSAGTGSREFTLTQRGMAFPVPEAKLPGIIELSPNGTLLSWRDFGNGWAMEFAMSPNNPRIPERLSVSHPAGYAATITVKKMEQLTTPFKNDQLDLTLPGGTSRKPLSQ